MSDYTMKWAWVCSQAKFDELRSDKTFVTLIRLARIANALRFCQGAALASAKDFNPEGRRQRSNSFLFTCGLLFEGFNIVKQSSSHLGKYKAQRVHFEKGGQTVSGWD